MGMVREILSGEILSRDFLSECLSITLRESDRLLRSCSRRVFLMPVRRVERNGERELRVECISVCKTLVCVRH